MKSSGPPTGRLVAVVVGVILAVGVLTVAGLVIAGYVFASKVNVSTVRDERGREKTVRVETPLGQIQFDHGQVDPKRLDIRAIHAYLTRSYWAAGIPEDVVLRSVQGSLCFGLYEGERQVGFARAITDRATFAYLADVYVLEEFRGRGLGRWLIECVMAHPALQGLRRMMLVTRDAHWLYRPFGFAEPDDSSRYMEIRRSNVYATER